MKLFHIGVAIVSVLLAYVSVARSASVQLAPVQSEDRELDQLDDAADQQPKEYKVVEPTDTVRYEDLEVKNGDTIKAKNEQEPTQLPMTQY